MASESIHQHSTVPVLLLLMHTGSCAQNSFQIDSINSCSTSKKLLFWLKIVKIIYFLTIKPIKGKLGFILKIMKKMPGGALLGLATIGWNVAEDLNFCQNKLLSKPWSTKVLLLQRRSTRLEYNLHGLLWWYVIQIRSLSSVECKCGQIKTLQRQTFKVRWWIQSSFSFDMNNYMWRNFFLTK